MNTFPATGYNWEEETNQGFLQELRWLTSRNKIILILDESLTGFRLSMGGGQAYFKITPDLAVFGNAVANGFTLSALVGREKFMKKMNDLYIGATSGGEALSLMAALAIWDAFALLCGLVLCWLVGIFIHSFNALRFEKPMAWIIVVLVLGLGFKLLTPFIVYGFNLQQNYCIC